MPSSVCSALCNASCFRVWREKYNMTISDSERSIAIEETTKRLSLTDKVLLTVLGHFHISRRKYTKKSANSKKNRLFILY